MVLSKEQSLATIKSIFLTLELSVFVYPSSMEDVNLRIAIYFSYYILFYCFNVHKGYEKVRNESIEYYKNLED